MALWESIAELWRKQIGPCKKAKEAYFGKTARRAWDYLGKSYKHLHLDEEQFRVPIQPMFKTRRNLAREYVALMLPLLHHQVPTRLVAPRRPPISDALLKLMASDDPRQADTAAKRQLAMGTHEQMLAFLLQWWLNYLPTLYGLSREARTAIPEALVKGRAVVWCELTASPHGPVPASFYGSVDDLFCDPDSRQWRDCGYIMRRRHGSLRQVAQRFGLNLEELRTQHQIAFTGTGDEIDEARSDVLDVASEKERDGAVYYEVWSRIGLGHALVNAPEEVRTFAAELEGLGQHVWLAIMPGVPYPLNVPPGVMTGPDALEEVKRRLRWPIESYADTANPWPCSVLDFYPNSDNPWGSSPLEGCLPLLAFLDHVYSYMLGRIARSSCDLIITSAEMEEAVRSAIRSGVDLEIIVANGRVGEDLKKLMEIITFPPMQSDIWRVIPLVERAFEKASGMVPEAYGAQPATQDRSATATQAREAHLTSRPQDFANAVEAWHSDIASTEALASRLYVRPHQVAPLFGEAMQESADGLEFPDGDLTANWIKLVNTDDPMVAASEMLYTVEGGSGQRKNKRKQTEDAIQILQILMPVAQELIGLGNVAPYNRIIDFLAETFEQPLQEMKLSPFTPPQAAANVSPQPAANAPPQAATGSFPVAPEEAVTSGGIA